MPDFTEDDLLPISALQHLEFCERQWALIHLEQIWDENRLTAEGRVLHERVDSDSYETRQGVRTVHALPLRSLTLGLSGRADVVEFHPLDPSGPPPARTGRRPGHFQAGAWLAYPIEFKRGRRKRHSRCDEVQLCAQALCLEEMLGVLVPTGALFYGQTRRRVEVALNDELRAHTIALVARMHRLFAEGITPPPVPIPGCANCSLVERCLPGALGRRRRVDDYLLRALSAPEATRTSEPRKDSL